MGPEIFGAGQSGASGGSAAFDPVHIEIVNIFKPILGDGLGRVITPDDRYVRYQGPLEALDVGYGYPEDFPADKSPVIRPFQLPDTMGDYSYLSAIGPFPAGLYQIEHTGILHIEPAVSQPSFFDVFKRFLVRIPAGATTVAEFYAQYNDPWSSEISMTRTGGDNGGPPGGDGAANLMDFQGYRMTMSGMVHLNEGDSLMVLADAAGTNGGGVLYWNRLVARKIGETVPKLQAGALDWAP